MDCLVDNFRLASETVTRFGLWNGRSRPASPMPTRLARAKPRYWSSSGTTFSAGDRENGTSALYRRCDLYLSPTVAMKAPTNTV